MPENDPFRLEIMKKIDEQKEDTKKILKILLGNGEIGLCERVRDNKTDIEKQKKDYALIKKILIGMVILLLSSGTVTVTQVQQLIKAMGV